MARRPSSLRARCPDSSSRAVPRAAACCIECANQRRQLVLDDLFRELHDLAGAFGSSAAVCCRVAGGRAAGMSPLQRRAVAGRRRACRSIPSGRRAACSAWRRDREAPLHPRRSRRPSPRGFPTRGRGSRHGHGGSALNGFWKRPIIAAPVLGRVMSLPAMLIELRSTMKPPAALSKVDFRSRSADR